VRSSEPHDHPRILFNYMSHPDDWSEWRACIRLTREIMAQPAMARYAGEEIQPGRAVASDTEIDAFVRAHCESAYHPCGTCKMGDAADPLAVVDPECRVIGIDGLRVADSSIMPLVTNANLNAPTLMIGEKASDMILGRDSLPPSNQEPWISPNWRESQR
jgi:choline dehydrogenase